MKYEMKNEIIITNHQQWFVRYMWPSMHSIEPTFSPPPLRHQTKYGAKDLVVRDLGQVTYHKFRDKLILLSFFNSCTIIQDSS